MTKGILVLGVLVLTINVSAQKSDVESKKVYPVVFQIGELPKVFEELSEDYEKPLVEVCDDDLKKAHARWMDLLKAMEKHAAKSNYDLKGVKMWLKVFWGEDGTIEHIAFHLKPASKNVDTKVLGRFLADFAKNYKSKIQADSNFSQYSSASFPTLPQIVGE